MSVVPEQKSHVFFDRFVLLSKLGEGTFGTIFKGFDTITKEKVAIKVESKKQSSSGQLKTEAKMYKLMENVLVSRSRPWPKLHFFGKDERENHVMIMDLLGPNIEEVLKKTAKFRLASETIAYMAEKMITLVEKFHDKGFVHRDLKPQNFVLEHFEERFPKYPELYLIDYGLAKPFIDEKSNTHAPFIQEKGLKGTVRYTSINTHLGIDQSRRDDIQSLGYIFTYMALGKLPWQNQMKNREKLEGYYNIMNIKMCTPVEILTDKIHEPLKKAITSYILYSESLAYHEEPNYNYCRELFRRVSDNFTGNIFKNSL